MLPVALLTPSTECCGV